MDKEFEKEFEKLKTIMQKLKSYGIAVDPFNYDFVYSHIPVGTLKKPNDDFDYSKIYAKWHHESSSFYIHIPFCKNNCRYCYFPKKTISRVAEGEIDEYLFYLKKEFLLLKNHFVDWNKINSIYIGGGTPSILNLDQLKMLFEIIDEITKINSARPEIAIEIHPSCNDRKKMDFLIKEKKISRISFGIQTFNNFILKKLGRDNSGYEWIINYLKEMSFNNWNVDLIYGVPFQTLDNIKSDLEKIIEISPPSITWYQLWYKPRKKEKNVILQDIDKSNFMNREDILYSRLYIYHNLLERGYTNVSEDWYVRNDLNYTKYAENKIKSAGNIGIGLGAYQAYGDYIFENFSEWDSYKKAINSNKLPIQWIREMSPLEQFVRKTAMGLKGLREPEPIVQTEFERFNQLSKGSDIENFFIKISKLEYLKIMEREDGKIIINSNYHLIRDYLICYLLHNSGWHIEKEGILESFSGLNIWEAKEKIKNIIKDIVGNEPYSIGFFIAIYSEDDKDFKLNISRNYIKDKNGRESQKDSVADFSRETKGKFSFLKKFYLPPTYLKEEICIISSNSVGNFDIISINIDKIENEIERFLKMLGLDYSHIEKDYDYVKSYYSSTLKEWLILDKNTPLYVYHIPLFPELGIGGIEIATTKYFEKDQLQYIKQTVIGCFTDRLSREINKYEKFMSLKYALRSAVASIMARNKSHIHGSHIEHGLRNRMDTFEKIIINRLNDNDNAELLKKIEELFKTKDFEFKIKTFIKDEAQKRLSFYRQRQDDLSARMATEWPQWGCSLDFYTHLILPLKQNPLVLHFINLSDGYSLMDIEIKFGYYKDSATETISWIEEFIGFVELKENKQEFVQKKEADLVDFALQLVTNNSDAKVDGYFLNNYLDCWKFQYLNRHPFSINLRDADIGAQAFFALFEGIIRNASKHGQDDNNGHRFKIKIVGCDTWQQVNSLVDFEEDDYQPNNPYKFKYILISVGCDLITKNGDIQKIGDKPLIQALRNMISNGIIDDTGKIIPGNWGIKEMKVCAAFVSGEPIDETQKNCPDYFHIGKTRGNKIWNDGKERICYIVRFEKPRIALALVPKDNWPLHSGKEEWEGVRFVDHPDNIFNGEIDYDFLYVDNSWKDAVENLLKTYDAALPQRIVYGELNFIDISSFHKQSFSHTWLYDRFLEKYLDKASSFLRIYFDNSSTQKAWRNNLKDNWISKVNIDFEQYFNVLENGAYQMCIAQHCKLKKFRAENDRRADLQEPTPYYVQHVSANDLFFNFLLSLDPSTQIEIVQLVLRQIIEATLFNVLIIDERISESLYSIKAPDEPGISLAEKLYWMGINVAKSLWVGSKKIWESPGEKSKTGNESSKGQIDRLVKFVINKDGEIETTTFDNLPIHVLFIHATRLNEILKEWKEKEKKREREFIYEFINKNKEKIPYIIVHSGRGKTEGDIPDNAPFVEYSTLERYLLSEPSKFYLIQIALSAKAEKK